MQLEGPKFLKNIFSPNWAQTSLITRFNDIDFYVGGLSETPINGALLGPTFSCIIALQFRDFKKGDRFFYENGPSETAFSIGKYS